MVYFLIKNSDNYIQDENGKTWIAACSEKKIVLKTDEALRIHLAESDYLVLINLSALLDSNSGDDNNNESSMSDSDEACKELLMDDIDAIEVDDDTLDVIFKLGRQRPVIWKA